MTGTEPDPDVADHELAPSTRPLSALPAVAVLVILAIICKGFLFGGDDGNTRAAAAAQDVSASTRPASTAPLTAPATPRNVPLRPPPDDGCVTKEWCGKALGYASIIVDVGRRNTDLPQRAWVIAVATAMQESSLTNEANEAYEESKFAPYDKFGDDHDSVGLFQQRPSQGWGSPAELMNPRISALKFYNALKSKVANWPGWDDPSKVSLTDIAQKVQRSKYPDAYQKREAGAIKVVDYVLQYTYTGSAIGTTAKNSWFVMIRCAKPQSADCQETPWTLTSPVQINRDAYAKYYPGEPDLYGDLGDEAHMGDDPKHAPGSLQDHTPVAQTCWQGKCAGYGWIYAQDFGLRPGFDLNKFCRWLLDSVRAGKYKGIRYIISTIPANKGVDGGRYFGIFNQADGWRAQPHDPDHDKHVHVSYEPGWERDTTMNIIADFYASQGA